MLYIEQSSLLRDFALIFFSFLIFFYFHDVDLQEMISESTQLWGPLMESGPFSCVIVSDFDLSR